MTQSPPHKQGCIKISSVHKLICCFSALTILCLALLMQKVTALCDKKQSPQKRQFVLTYNMNIFGETIALDKQRRDTVQ